MGLKRQKIHSAAPITMVAFALSLAGISAAASGTEIHVAPVQETQTETDGVRDSDSFTRAYLWNSSFDYAADATKSAEIELRKGYNIKCDEASMNPEGNAQPQLIQERMQRCQEISHSAAGFADEASRIRRMQYIFADVSRASDIAAVGAIGAMGYQQLMKRNPAQSESLEGVAKVQETAGKVSYVTGASDITMGAYAYLQQKRRLEKMKETLSGRVGDLQMTSENAAMANKLKNAAEETKKAAYSHMMYGAGKVAVGYASMQLAKQNRKQAENLKSIDVDGLYGQQGGISYTAPQFDNSGGVPYYQNNDVQMILPSGANTGSSANSGSSGNDSFSFGSGASAMPAASSGRNLASNKKGGGLGGLGGIAGGSAGGSSSGGGELAEEASAEGPDATKQTMGESFEVKLTGGGSRWGGGGSSSASDDSGGMAGLLGAMIGGGENSSATGVNPNKLYKDATLDLDGSEQGSMAGVSAPDGSLFQQIKSKYNKMMEVGRLQGPGAVEVRN